MESHVLAAKERAAQDAKELERAAPVWRRALKVGSLVSVAGVGRGVAKRDNEDGTWNIELDGAFSQIIRVDSSKITQEERKLQI